MDLILQQLYYSTFHSEFTPIPIDYRKLTVVEIVKDMDWLRWTHMAKQVGARSSYRESTCFDQPPSNWMFRGSDAHKTCLSSYDHGKNIGISFEDHSERTRPIFFGK